MRSLFVSAALLVVAVPAAAKPDLAGVAKKQGLTLAGDPVEADFDGDGKPETIHMCEGKKGLQVCVFAVAKESATLKNLLPPAGGKKLGKLEPAELLAEVLGQELVVEVYDETPDEKVKRVRVYAGHPQPREIFTSVIFLPKDKSQRGAWDEPDVVRYGDARPGWEMVDFGEDGKHEIVVRRRPKVISVDRDGQGAARLLVGVSQAVFEYVGTPSAGEYRERAGEAFNDFLNPGYDIDAVRASSTWVEPSVLRELKSEALAAAVYEDEAAKKAGEGEPPVDLAAFTSKGADKSLDTGWIADGKGGKGEWLEVDLAEASPIHMVRIVPGCHETKGAYGQHNVPDKIEIRLDDKERAFVDLKTPRKVTTPVLAVQPVKIPSKPWAQQYLVFLDGNAQAKTVRVTIDRVKKQGGANRACIAEVTVH